MTYDKGYADGYNDGFRAGLEAGKGLKTPPTLPDLWPHLPVEKPKCRVCGMVFEGVMGYVCPHNNCPGKVTCL
jgi:hypothetical protein